MKQNYLVYILLVLICFITIFLIYSDYRDKSKITIRVGHNQEESHPSHLGYLKFAEYIEDRLGDKYNVLVYPNETLGSQSMMAEMVSNGALEFAVASSSIMESFNEDYKVFNLPYLFNNVDEFKETMNNSEITDEIFNSTKDMNIVAVTWLYGGVRNFYTKKPVKNLKDLENLRIRIQESESSMEMANLLGFVGVPMSLGETYDALKNNIIDGAENNELSITILKNGDFCKFYSYDMHLMIPDLFLASNSFLESLSDEERKVFEEAFVVLNKTVEEEMNKEIEKAKKEAVKMGVEFIYPDKGAFKKACEPMYDKLFSENKDIKKIYDKIKSQNFVVEN